MTLKNGLTHQIMILVLVLPTGKNKKPLGI